ncbi:uncharacterized protein LMH87_008079 [Akanthomyces muscarius]|uniref:Uncharacterized protein n=1 Tax=Akanthomyces muscarius TaxID=2231603 RepID=A0A9W8QKY3_AKAMU|nr:uncharacterized protein LMH87_008079 [Akanthomyces muscarius]KAJ4159168.1 hypothetical protein LMH87_008079 [Akanthomyces muscarius]
MRRGPVQVQKSILLLSSIISAKLVWYRSMTWLSASVTEGSFGGVIFNSQAFAIFLGDVDARGVNQELNHSGPAVIYSAV